MTSTPTVRLDPHERQASAPCHLIDGRRLRVCRSRFTLDIVRVRDTHRPSPTTRWPPFGVETIVLMGNALPPCLLLIGMLPRPQLLSSPPLVPAVRSTPYYAGPESRQRRRTWCVAPDARRGSLSHLAPLPICWCCGIEKSLHAAGARDGRTLEPSRLVRRGASKARTGLAMNPSDRRGPRHGPPTTPDSSRVPPRVALARGKQRNPRACDSTHQILGRPSAPYRPLPLSFSLHR